MTNPAFTDSSTLSPQPPCLSCCACFYPSLTLDCLFSPHLSMPAIRPFLLLVSWFVGLCLTPSAALWHALLCVPAVTCHSTHAPKFPYTSGVPPFSARSGKRENQQRGRVYTCSTSLLIINGSKICKIDYRSVLPTFLLPLGLLSPALSFFSFTCLGAVLSLLHLNHSLNTVITLLLMTLWKKGWRIDRKDWRKSQ